MILEVTMKNTRYSFLTNGGQGDQAEGLDRIPPAVGGLPTG